MQPLIEYLVRALVDRPEEIRVTEFPGEGATTYVVRVAPGDVGKVLGKEGRMAVALRVLVKSVAKKYGRKVLLHFVADARAVEDRGRD